MKHQKNLYLEHDRIRTYQESGFQECSLSDIKFLYSGAIVPLSLLNIHMLKLSDLLSYEELKLHVEIRMYEEGSLNSEEEYTIGFIRHSINTENDALIEVFALSHTKARDYFAEVLPKTSIIDSITPAFMVYGDLYNTLPKGNDLFIYWSEEEAYGAIYQDGHYIAHRSIDTLSTIAVETGLEIRKLKNDLQTKGLIKENYLVEEVNKSILIEEKIAKNIERIVHTINHKRGLFGITKIDHIYLDFEGNDIKGLKSIFNAYGISDANITPLTLPNVAASQLHETLCASYLQDSEISLNLSPFTRKAAWYSRESGKFLGFVVGALFIIILAFIAMEWMISNEERRSEELNARLEVLKKKTEPYLATLQKNTTLLTKQQSSNKLLLDDISLIKGAEETASLIRDMHIQRQQFLIDTTSEMGPYRLGALLLEQNGSKEMNILVVSDYRKRDDIAKFMSGLYARGYQNVETHEIKLDNNNTTYNSLVKVTR